MKYPISDQISDFLDIRIRFSVFPIRTEPYPTFYYPTISVFDFLISAHLLAVIQIWTQVCLQSIKKDNDVIFNFLTVHDLDIWRLNLY